MRAARGFLGDAVRQRRSVAGRHVPHPSVFDDAALPDSQQQARFKPRHNGGGNIAYGDGHAKWVRPEQTWRSFHDNDWRRNPIKP